jgi:O-antigen chain-terminating methyltransferase
MIEMNTPGVDVHKLMELVIKEASRLPSPESTNGEKKAIFPPCPEFPPCPLNIEPSALPRKASYHLEELLSYHGDGFIDNAYLSILRRKPDHEGKNSFLTRLRCGELTKTDIIGRLRYSKEGRRHNIPIKGLHLPFLLQLLYQVRVLGRITRLVTAVFNLPTIFKNIQVLENTVFNENHMIKTAIHSNSNHLIKLSEHIGSLHEKLENSISSNTKEIQVIANDLEKLDKKTIQIHQTQKKTVEESLATLSDQLSTQMNKAMETHQQLVNMKYQIDQLNDSFQKQNCSSGDQQQPNTVEEVKNHSFDSMYSDFQDKFRGTRQEVKRRISFYLPFAQKALTATETGLILDIGCGRGEWLELLEEKNINARGLDLNRVMVNRCHEMHLDVIETDAMDYLKKLDSNSISVLTGFHIVEHLSLNILISLIDESFRVIKPGGIVIFETPNPENIIVGACNFYTDPTHKNPIPPETLEFLLNTRGFTNIQIHRLNLMKEVRYIKDNDMQDVNDVLFAMSKEQDYAVIGYKE